jgi:hypothetical protein
LGGTAAPRKLMLCYSAFAREVDGSIPTWSTKQFLQTGCSGSFAVFIGEARHLARMGDWSLVSAHARALILTRRSPPSHTAFPRRTAPRQPVRHAQP